MNTRMVTHICVTRLVRTCLYRIFLGSLYIKDPWCFWGLFILEPNVASQDPWFVGRLLVFYLCVDSLRMCVCTGILRHEQSWSPIGVEAAAVGI